MFSRTVLSFTISTLPEITAGGRWRERRRSVFFQNFLTSGSGSIVINRMVPHKKCRGVVIRSKIHYSSEETPFSRYEGSMTYTA